MVIAPFRRKLALRWKGKGQATEKFYGFAIFLLAQIQYLMWGCFCCSVCGDKEEELQGFTHHSKKRFYFFSEEVTKFPVWIISLWSHSAWTWLADFRHLAVRKNACAISYSFPTMIPEPFLNTGYRHSHSFCLTSYCCFCGLVCFSPQTSGECLLIHEILPEFVGEHDFTLFLFSLLLSFCRLVVCQRQDVCKPSFHNSVVGILM